MSFGKQKMQNVHSVAYLPPKASGQSLVAAGCADGTILVFKVPPPAPTPPLTLPSFGFPGPRWRARELHSPRLDSPIESTRIVFTYRPQGPRFLPQNTDTLCAIRRSELDTQQSSTTMLVSSTDPSPLIHSDATIT